MSAKDKKAGPPKCVYCGEIMEGWTRKWVDDNSLLWMCPNYCSFRHITVPTKESKSSVNPELSSENRTHQRKTVEQDIENPMLGMLPDLEYNRYQNISDKPNRYENVSDAEMDNIEFTIFKHSALNPAVHDYNTLPRKMKGDHCFPHGDDEPVC